jgi:predicted permease
MWTPWKRRRPVEAGVRDEVDDEVRFHLDARTEALIARGMEPEAARAQSVREFGDIDDARRYMSRLDDRREAAGRRRNLMAELHHDIVYALRRLRSAPAFTVTAIVTLALGIGANTAIFSIVNSVLFRPLPFPEPERLYAIYSANRTANQLQAPVSPVDLDDWRTGRRVIEDIGGHFYAEGSTGVDLTGRGDPRRLSTVFFTPGFLTALGIAPVEGRLPREDEMVRGGHDTVVLLTHAFWMREFGGSRQAIGSPITLNGRSHDVLGVLPPTLRFPTGDADVFVPYSTIPDTSIPRIRPVRVLGVVARARPGVSEEDVRAEMLAITRGLAERYPEDRAWDAATVRPLHDVVTGPVREGLLVLFGAVAFVLLMTSANVASLQLARAATRGREIAVRLALGARRDRIVRQLLTESLVLAALGGAAGIALGRAGLAGLLALSAGQLPRAAEVGLDATVLAFAIGTSLLAGLLFGLAPALRATSPGLQQTLREGGRSMAGAESTRLRTGLVVAEVALAMVLVVGAGLMGRSFMALLHVDPGFRSDHLVAVQFTIDPRRHAGPEGADPAAGSPYTLYYQQIIDTVRTLPGVAAAAAVKDPPFRGNGERNGFRLPGQTIRPGQDAPSATTIHVSAGYFATIGARMVQGREFTAADRAGAPLAVVVNEAFERQYFPGERAAGKKLLMGEQVPVEIVGVVNDIRQVAMAEPARPTMYVHNLQNSRVKTTIVARTHGDPLAMAPAIRDVVWSLDPQQTITAIFTFDDAVDRALARPRLLAVLLGGFGALGLVLGTLGVYGVLVYLVGQRQREIGVRLALGAQPGRVLAMFVRRGLALAVTGIAIGLAGALALSRYLATVLYGVGPADAATLAGVAAILVAAAAVASWLPARRAARVDPAVTLRAE